MGPKPFDPETFIPSLTDKVILITGGTAGLGAESIKILSKHSPKAIVFTGRNSQRANTLIETIHNTVPGANVTFLKGDISEFSSIQSLARDFLQKFDRLDVLMCNAGVMALPPGTGKDGYETQFTTNYLGHALLIKLLLPIMLQTAERPNADVRIVHLTSIAYRQAPPKGIDFATLKSPQDGLGNIIPGGRWTRYGQSKLAQILYAQEFAKRYPQIRTVSVHPGIIITGLFEGVPLMTQLPVLIGSIGKKTSVEEGPYNQVWAATCPRGDLINGEYYEPVGQIGKRTTKQARDGALAQELWMWTEKELEAL